MMKAQLFDARIESWTGRDGTDLATLDGALQGVRSGDLLDRFVTDTSRYPNGPLLRVALIGYGVAEGEACGRYAVLRSRIEEDHNAFRGEVVQGHRAPNGELRLGSLLVRPPGSSLPPKIGVLRLARVDSFS